MLPGAGLGEKQPAPPALPLPEASVGRVRQETKEKRAPCRSVWVFFFIFPPTKITACTKMTLLCPSPGTRSVVVGSTPPVPEPPRDALQEARPSCPAFAKLSELSLEIVTLTASGGAFIYF